MIYCTRSRNVFTLSTEPIDINSRRVPGRDLDHAVILVGISFAVQKYGLWQSIKLAVYAWWLERD